MRAPAHSRLLAPATLALVVAIATPLPAAAHLSIIRQGLESHGVLEAHDDFGRALAAGDFDGDGFDDLAIGSPFEDDEPRVNSGAVIVSYGGKYGFTPERAQYLDATTIGYATTTEARFGSALAVGDFNGDQYDDLAIGAPSTTVSGHVGAGMVFVIYGSATGLQGQAAFYTQDAANEFPEDYDFFGCALATGKFGGNVLEPYDDLVIGAYGENNSAGAVSFGFKGTASGLDATAANTRTQESFSGEFDVPGQAFGFALAAGDLIDDGYDDLVIGVPFWGRPPGLPQVGRVWILRGTSGGISTSNNPLDYTAAAKDAVQPSAYFGRSLAVGRFFDSTHLSLAIGEPGRQVSSLVNAGRVIVVRSDGIGLDFSGTNGRILTQGLGGTFVHAGDRFGEALAAGDYWTGDGYDDLGVGSPGDSWGFGASNAGQFQIFPGLPNGPDGSGWSSFAQGTLNDDFMAGDLLGAAVAFGRFDETNNGSFAVGAPGERAEIPIYQPTTLLEDAGMVHDISPWRQAFAMPSWTAGVSDCLDQLVFTVKPYDQVKIASTTKVMTLLLAAEAIQRGDVAQLAPYTVPSWVASDANINGSQANPQLATNETLTLEGLLYLLIFHSANDGAYCIADLLMGGGGQTSFTQFEANVIAFVARMNARAAELGMGRSQFNNPNGFDSHPSWLGTTTQHVSTMYDMWLLCTAAMQNPLVRQIVGATTYTVVRSGQPSGISYGWGFVGQPGVTGIKPGGTPLARSTGTYAATPSSGTGEVVGGSYGSPNTGLEVFAGNLLMQLGMSACGEPWIPVVPPFGLAFGGSSAAGSYAGNSTEIGVEGDLELDLFRQSGAGDASARIVVGHQATLLLKQGESETLGIAPFREHDGIQIVNPDTLPHDLLVTVTNEPDPVLVTVPPESLVILPAYALDEAIEDFQIRIEPALTDCTMIEVHVRIRFAFDEVITTPPQASPVRSWRLMRGAPVGLDGVWMEIHGLDPAGVVAVAGSDLHLILHESGTTVDVGDPPVSEVSAPSLRMLPPAPNPFRASTSIGFHLERPGRVAGEIYDLHGRLVTRFEERAYAVGRGRFTWDGRTESGVPLDSGVYFYRLRLDGRTAGTGRVMLMR